MLMNQRLSGAPILAADIDSRRASVLPQVLQDKVTAICFESLCNCPSWMNQVDSLRKGSGHIFVGQVSWKEEGSIPVITSAEVSATAFMNSCPTPTRLVF